jgi:hypothetical protein
MTKCLKGSGIYNYYIEFNYFFSPNCPKAKFRKKIIQTNSFIFFNCQFGLLSVACVPGGGFGHVAVIISKSDIPLSVTMNLISIVATGKCRYPDIVCHTGLRYSYKC